jgi:hypothetical protein
MLIARAFKYELDPNNQQRFERYMQFGRRQLNGDRKRLWRERETSRSFSRICRVDLNESGTEHQSRTLMSSIVQVSGNGMPQSHVN